MTTPKLIFTVKGTTECFILTHIHVLEWPRQSSELRSPVEHYKLCSQIIPTLSDKKKGNFPKKMF